VNSEKSESVISCKAFRVGLAVGVSFEKETSY